MRSVLISYPRLEKTTLDIREYLITGDCSPQPLLNQHLDIESCAWDLWDALESMTRTLTCNPAVLFIQATDDPALPPALSDGMERFVPNLTKKQVEAAHWALWQKPVEVNGMIREWFEGVERTKSNL